jgi:hypothetical protein
VLGGYSQAAVDEKKSADSLRMTSVFCMALMVVIVAVTLFEILFGSYYITWESLVSRIAFTLIVSVPAAYFAKESNNHRLKYYEYKQTSLDLHAVSPYLKSLPEDEQNRLKSEFAQKLFINKSLASEASNSYPIDTQQLILKLIDALKDTTKKT